MDAGLDDQRGAVTAGRQGPGVEGAAAQGAASEQDGVGFGVKGNGQFGGPIRQARAGVGNFLWQAVEA